MDWKQQAISAAAMLAWEAWLGRTNKVEAASTVDLVINGALAVGSAILKKNQKPEGK